MRVPYWSMSLEADESCRYPNRAAQRSQTQAHAAERWKVELRRWRVPGQGAKPEPTKQLSKCCNDADAEDQEQGVSYGERECPQRDQERSRRCGWMRRPHPDLCGRRKRHSHYGSSHVSWREMAQHEDGWRARNTEEEDGCIGGSNSAEVPCDDVVRPGRCLLRGVGLHDGRRAEAREKEDEAGGEPEQRGSSHERCGHERGPEGLWEWPPSRWRRGGRL